MLKNILIATILWLSPIWCFAGKHVMVGDVLTGGATSYIQNTTSVQSATVYVTSASVDGELNVIDDSIAGNITLLNIPGIVSRSTLWLNNQDGLGQIWASTVTPTATTSEPHPAYLNLQSGKGSGTSVASLVADQAILSTPLGNQLVTLDSSGISLTGNIISSNTWTAVQNIKSMTLAQLQAYTPTSVGQLIYCSNCATDGICVSTGTSNPYSVGRVSARTTACQ